MGRRSLAEFAARDGGAVLIELALTLPMLFLLIVAIFDFGMLFRELEVVTNAAREGARMAVLPVAYSQADIEARVTSVLRAGGVTAVPVVQPIVNSTVTPADGPSFTTRRVVVRVDHTFSYLAPFAYVVGGTFATVPLRATSEMRTEVAGSEPFEP